MSGSSLLPSNKRTNPSLVGILNDGWVPYGSTGAAVYVSGTSFKITGRDVTADFTRGRKIRIYHASSATYKYVTVVSSAFVTDTTVTVSGNTLLSETYSSIDVALGSPVGYSNELPAGGAFTAGDMIYAGTDTMLTRLAKPAAPGVLVNDPTGIPQWAVTGWLPLNATLTYSSADDPTIVLTSSVDCSAWLSVGNKMKWVNGGNTIHAIVTVISGTTITCLQEIAPTSASAGGGTAARVATANSAITLPFFSYHRSPYGFPMDPRKWTIETTSATTLTQSSPTASTWYNVGSYAMSVPIGAWNLEYTACISNYKANSTQAAVSITLSTTTNSESDVLMSAFADVESIVTGVGVNIAVYAPVSRSKFVVLSSKTTHYLLLATLVASSAALLLYGGAGTGGTITRAKCAYL